MLDISLIRQDPERVKQAMRDKAVGRPELVDELLECDRDRRDAITRLQQAREEAKKVSAEIGDLMKSGRRAEAKKPMAENARLKQTIKELEEVTRTAEAAYSALMLEIPNIPHESVPVGRTPDDNQTVFEHGKPTVFSFEPLAHWDLIEKHRLVDFDRGAKVTGAGFPFYVGKGARLQRALINFFLDLATTVGGYVEMQPPVFVNAESATGTGQLPDKEDQMYEATRDGLYAVPTAEVPVTNYHRDEILAEADLPIKYCAFTSCFRREAGSYGKDVRGLNRLHQFDKVELVQFVHPDHSYDALESLREDAERLLQLLELPYRRLLMCTGDMGFTQAKKYDLEVWSAGQARWLEVSSISNFESFQALRAMIRYRPEDGGKVQPVHTLNGSALALPRIVAAILENNQQADGTILVPQALRPYTRFDHIG